MSRSTQSQVSSAEPRPSRWLTWANGLTLLRLLAAPALAWAILSEWTGTAHILFWLAVVTDLTDGRLARRRDEASPLGGLLDHATDATFVSIGLAALATVGVVPVLLPGLIVAAFVQYVVDSRSGGQRRLRASSLGRWNGIAYYVILGIPVVRNGLGLDWPPTWGVAFLAWVLVGSTVVSMADRARSARSAR